MIKDVEKRRKYDRDRYRNNPVRNEQAKKRSRERIRNKEQISQYQKDWHKKMNATPEGKLELRRRALKKYGLTCEDYALILRRQNGVCAICKKNETVKDSSGNMRRLDVDHNHITGKNRGLLCQSCNTALGKLKVDLGTELLLEAINYIERFNNAFNKSS